MNVNVLSTGSLDLWCLCGLLVAIVFLGCCWIVPYLC